MRDETVDLSRCALYNCLGLRQYALERMWVKLYVLALVMWRLECCQCPRVAGVVGYGIDENMYRTLSSKRGYGGQMIDKTCAFATYVF